MTPDADALRKIPRSLAVRHDLLAVSSDGNQLTVLLPNAEDRDVIDRVRLVTGMHVRAYSVPRDVIRAKISAAYPDQEFAVSQVAARGDEAPAVRALDSIHEQATSRGASDVHIEPTGSGGRVRGRVDGMLIEMQALSAELYVQLISRVKLLAGMDIADRRQPQDGRYALEARGRSMDARVSSMPTLLGEKVVVRLLDHHARIPSLESIGMPEPALSRFRRIVHAPHGFVVVCGPTGSGKTTTLYAAMAERNTESQSLCSVEDPVEVRIPGLAQVQVNVRAGVTFASALRGFLRQDPNVIMVGEMRDEETAAVASSASLSGQLVFTTLHSNDAPAAVERLVELGVGRQTIAAGLTALVAQRLVRKACASCRALAPLDEATAREFGISANVPIYRVRGCDSCAGTGYSGRLAIFEFMPVDAALRQCIAQGAPAAAIAGAARADGYLPMMADGLRRAAAGETTLEELRRVLVVGGAA